MKSTIKRFVLVLVLVAIVASGAFADDTWNNSFNIDSGPTPQNGALFVDLGSTIGFLILGGFGAGLGWEGRINDFSTYLINGSFGFYRHDYGPLWGFKTSALAFGIEGNYRYYFFKSALDKLFLNVGLGYGMTNWKFVYASTSIEDKDYSWGTLYIPLYVGWKLIIGKGFVVEADLGYRIGINIVKPSDDTSVSPAFGGVIAGLALGWAF